MVVKPGIGRKSSNKNPPIFSHEFVIQNHADIVSCVVMVFLIGLMVPASSSLASLFITLHHNVSGVEPSREIPTGEPFFYEAGWKDGCAIFFYSLVCIVMHAIIQEYFLDKVTKRFRLSKSKLGAMNESGQLIIYHIMTAAWGFDVIIRDGFLRNISLLWDGYPNHPMSFVLKLWWVVQASYWIHTVPELYFQRVKKDEWNGRIRQAIAGLAFVELAYCFKFQRVGVFLIALHSLGEVVAHASRLNSIIRAEKEDHIYRAFTTLNASTFVVVRLLTTVLSVLAFWYGLGGPASTQPLSLRLAALLTVCASQVYLMHNFITQQIALRRENQLLVEQTKAKNDLKDKIKKDKVKRSNAVESDLPEADQNTSKGVRLRSAAAGKPE